MGSVFIWLIAIITALLFLAGIVYYRITDAVVDPVAFWVSLAIIFIVLIMVIIYSVRNRKNKEEYSDSYYQENEGKTFGNNQGNSYDESEAIKKSIEGNEEEQFESENFEESAKPLNPVRTSSPKRISSKKKPIKKAKKKAVKKKTSKKKVTKKK